MAPNDSLAFMCTESYHTNKNPHMTAFCTPNSKADRNHRLHSLLSSETFLDDKGVVFWVGFIPN